MEIKESFLKKNRCYTNAIKIVPKGLMLHSVGCSQPRAEVFMKNWDNPDVSKCVHAFIDGNSGVIYQILPWTYKAWHCGSSGNSTHISVEMCESGDITYIGSSITVANREAALACAKRTYEAAVDLFAKLCKEYKLNPLTDICSHAEGYKKGIASNHGDPENYWKSLGTGYTMDKFRKAVADKMNGATASAPVSSAKTDKSDNKEVYKMRTLKKGMNNDIQVRLFQQFLIWKGYDLGKSGADGNFGPVTEKAVKAFQTKVMGASAADGVVGPKTWAAACP